MISRRSTGNSNCCCSSYYMKVKRSLRVSSLSTSYSCFCDLVWYVWMSSCTLMSMLSNFSINTWFSCYYASSSIFILDLVCFSGLRFLLGEDPCVSPPYRYIPFILAFCSMILYLVAIRCLAAIAFLSLLFASTVLCCCFCKLLCTFSRALAFSASCCSFALNAVYYLTICCSRRYTWAGSIFGLFFSWINLSFRLRMVSLRVDMWTWSSERRANLRLRYMFCSSVSRMANSPFSDLIIRFSSAVLLDAPWIFPP